MAILTITLTKSLKYSIYIDMQQAELKWSVVSKFCCRSAFVRHGGPRDAVPGGAAEPGVRLHPVPRLGHQGHPRAEQCALAAQRPGHHADVGAAVAGRGRGRGPRRVRGAVRAPGGGAAAVRAVPPHGRVPGRARAAAQDQ